MKNMTSRELLTSAFAEMKAMGGKTNKLMLEEFVTRVEEGPHILLALSAAAFNGLVSCTEIGEESVVNRIEHNLGILRNLSVATNDAVPIGELLAELMRLKVFEGSDKKADGGKPEDIAQQAPEGYKTMHDVALQAAQRMADWKEAKTVKDRVVELANELESPSAAIALAAFIVGGFASSLRTEDLTPANAPQALQQVFGVITETLALASSASEVESAIKAEDVEADNA